MIEPRLRPASPKNGNIRGVSQRLSPNLALIPGNREHRDGAPNCKSPLLAGLSATIGGIFSEPRTAWLGREDSNLRMVESKSGRTFNEINAHSEYSAEFGPKCINRLADDSE
jgi:hypothetical protein